MERKRNGSALITGATSGIGAAFARALAARGYDLILVGRREEELAAVARTLGESFRVSAEAVVAELSDEDSLGKLISRIRGLDIRMLVNNAGYGWGRRFHEDELDNQLAMVRVHVLAAMKLAHAVIPGMIERRGGAIIHVSSLAAFFPLPRNVAYCSTKNFLVSFSETLHLELAPYGITVQALCPGFTRTRFHSRMGTKVWDGFGRNIVWMEADAVAQASLRALGKGKVICIPGFFNRLLVALRVFIPKRLYYRLVSGAHSRFSPRDQ